MQTRSCLSPPFPLSLLGRGNEEKGGKHQKKKQHSFPFVCHSEPARVFWGEGKAKCVSSQLILPCQTRLERSWEGIACATLCQGFCLGSSCRDLSQKIHIPQADLPGRCFSRSFSGDFRSVGSCSNAVLEAQSPGRISLHNGLHLKRFAPNAARWPSPISNVKRGVIFNSVFYEFFFFFFFP